MNHRNLAAMRFRNLSAIALAAALQSPGADAADYPARQVRMIVGAVSGGGVGTAGHLSGELFSSMAGVKMVHVPYKGGPPSMIDLIAGRLQLVFATAVVAVPQIKAGKIKALAVTTAKRSVFAPELPTIAEAGLPGFEANNWYGLVAPAKTPGDIISRLNKEVVALLNLPDVKETPFKQGIEAAPGTPEEFGAYIKSEITKWSQVVKASGAKAN